LVKKATYIGDCDPSNEASGQASKCELGTAFGGTPHTTRDSHIYMIANADLFVKSYSIVPIDDVAALPAVTLFMEDLG